MIRPLAFVLWLGLCLTGSGMAAQAVVTLPDTARLVLQNSAPNDSYALPTGPFDGAAVPAEVAEGTVTTQIWQLDAPGVTTLQILAPLRDQLAAEGYAVLFDCDTDACGGFDFRFGTPVADPPEMVVNLRDFRFLSARLPGPDIAIGLMVSATPNTGYVQVISVSPGLDPVPPAGTARPPGTGPDLRATGGAGDAPLSAALLRDGYVILSDLTFRTGSATLGPGPFPSLEGLAAFLAADPARRIALVGHTDAIGGLPPNIALSRRRAQAVRTRLAEVHGAAPAQMEADGVGYLSPLASNATEAGRDRNRRVEAVLLAGE
jgi:OOP family OmpA-OmpF porin